MVSEEVYLVKI